MDRSLDPGIRVCYCVGPAGWCRPGRLVDITILHERTVPWVANKTRQSNSGSTELFGSSPDSPFLRLKGVRQQRAVGWDDVEPDLLSRCAARVTEAGALFSLSKTSDGGALHLFVKNGTEIAEMYFSSGEEATEYLLQVYEAFG